MNNKQSNSFKKEQIINLFIQSIMFLVIGSIAWSFACFIIGVLAGIVSLGLGLNMIGNWIYIPFLAIPFGVMGGLGFYKENIIKDVKTILYGTYDNIEHYKNIEKKIDTL